MHLERDEFEVTFDASQIDEQKIIETIDGTAFKASLVASRANLETQSKAAGNEFALPSGFKILDDAYRQAQKENRALLIDFYAEWCVPCRRLESETLADAKVREILQKIILLKIDTDKEAELAEKFGVVALPDLRLITPAGKEAGRWRGFQSAEELARHLEDIFRTTEKQTKK